MKRIGVITHWGSLDNYGQTLQAYSLQKYLRNAGYDPYLIRYLEDGIRRPLIIKLLKLFNPFYLRQALRFRRLNKIDYENNIKHNRDLRRFLDQTVSQAPKIYGREDLLTNPPSADVFVTGSDQVWNKLDLSYFLDFVSGKKKIAYAASFGATNYSGKKLEIIRELFKPFAHITVRETSGVEVCKRAGVNNVKVVPDPTILLRKEDYETLYGNSNSEKPYMVIYILGNKIDFDIAECYRYAEEKGLSVKYIAGQRQEDELPKIYPGMEEWLGLIAHAECVVTNSFHGSVMSLILNTPFITVPLSGTAKGMNDRVTTLLGNFGLTSRLTTALDKLSESIDFDRVNEKLSELREYGRDVLTEMIEN